LCVSSAEPTDVLLRKQPPAVTASFFEKMRFLIEDGVIQNYAKTNAFNDRLVLEINFIFLLFIYMTKYIYLHAALQYVLEELQSEVN
jgi:hypothetical protein